MPGKPRRPAKPRARRAPPAIQAETGPESPERAALAPAEADGAEAAQRQGFPVVGIGASAGGLDALTALLRAVPKDSGMAFVVVQHLDPTHVSLLTEILSRVTPMPVHEVTDRLRVEPNQVYVIPPGRSMVIANGQLQLSGEHTRQQRSIDQFLRSLAADQGHRAIGVILSGSASDGTLGLEEIKAQGGITFAQDSTAQVDSMPRSAVASGCVDFVLAPEAIARELVRISRHPYVRPSAHEPPVPAAGEPGMARVLELVRAAQGVDFSRYKQNTVSRRIARRIILHKLDGLGDYVKLLQSSPREVEALYQDILISVTSFFRNPEAFELIRSKVFPRLTEGRSRHEPVRVWVLGCSTGEEAYSIAITYAEYADASGRHVPLQLFATDLNAGNIDRARQGVYSKHIAQDVSADRLRRFFVEVDGHYHIAKSIRDVCVFARHDVLASPPFSHIDLLSCRNLLIYLEPALQQAVVPILHYAVKPDGYLWLGNSETIGSYREHFELEEPRQKLYRRKALPIRLPGGLTQSEQAGASTEPDPTGAAPREGAAALANDVQKEADRLLMARYIPPSVLVNSEFEILHFRGDTGPFLAPPSGKASLNLLKMLRDGLLPGVRGALLKARKEETAVRLDDLRVKVDGGQRDVSVEVIPVRGDSQRQHCFLVLFDEGSAARPAGAAEAQAPAGPVDEKTVELESRRLKQELAATREYLQSVIEQQEAANEELQSANEEVQSTNEELQSINEELETSKEEIQSTNEELATVNDELQNRNFELSQTNNDFINIFTSVQMPIVMLGPDLRIRRFTPVAEKMFNLIAADVGRPIGDIKLNIDVPDLEGLVNEVLDTVSMREMETRDRLGRWFVLRVRPYRTIENRIDGAVMLLVDIDDLKRLEESLKRVQTNLLLADKDKDRFLAMLAHELRNPLAPLRNVGAVLKDGQPDASTLQWCGAVLDRQVHTMTRMIDDLLDVSRVTHGKVELRREHFDLRAVLERAVSQLGPMVAEKEQVLTVELPSEPMPMSGDTMRLEQVVCNLLSNASKFSPPHSEITLAATVDDPAGHPAQPGGRHAIVRVIDQGAGLGADMLEHIFGLFVQGDMSLARGHGGLGIGLTIARQLTELHNGRLRAYSEGKGKGSTFELRLPLSEERLPAEPTGPPPAKWKWEPRRVLVVDDNLDAAESLSRFLRTRGHVVEQAHDAEQALVVAARLKPEIGILDIGLPKVDGYELARRLRKQVGADGRLMLVALSGYGQEADMFRSSQAGFDAHLVKPVEPETLLRQIDLAPHQQREAGS